MSHIYDFNACLYPIFGALVFIYVDCLSRIHIALLLCASHEGMCNYLVVLFWERKIFSCTRAYLSSGKNT